MYPRGLFGALFSMDQHALERQTDRPKDRQPHALRGHWAPDLFKNTNPVIHKTLGLLDSALTCSELFSKAKKTYKVTVKEEYFAALVSLKWKAEKWKMCDSIV